MVSGDARLGFYKGECRSMGFMTGLLRAYQDVHLVEHPIGRNKIVSDAHSVRLHGV